MPTRRRHRYEGNNCVAVMRGGWYRHEGKWSSRPRRRPKEKSETTTMQFCARRRLMKQECTVQARTIKATASSWWSRRSEFGFALCHIDYQSMLHLWPAKPEVGSAVLGWHLIHGGGGWYLCRLRLSELDERLCELDERAVVRVGRARSSSEGHLRLLQCVLSRCDAGSFIGGSWRTS